METLFYIVIMIVCFVTLGIHIWSVIDNSKQYAKFLNEVQLKIQDLKIKEIELNRK